MNKKRKIIISCILFLIVIVTLFTSYGFIISEIVGNDTSKYSVFNGKYIKVEYSDGTEELSSNYDAFYPGSNITKEFTIKNTGEKIVNYSINLDSVVNTFERKIDITYELTDSEGVVLKNGIFEAKGIFPDKDMSILSKDTLDIGESKSYILTIRYSSSEYNQIVDNQRYISAKIGIDDSIANINELVIHGNTTGNGSVGERTENLINLLNISKNDSKAPIELNDGIITVKTGFSSVAEVYFDVEPITLTPGTYTLSLNNYNIKPYFYLIDENGSYIKDINNSNIMSSGNDNGVKTFTISKEQTFKQFMLFFQDRVENQEIKPMLTKTSEFIEYEPYGKYKIPIKTNGKNLIDISKSQSGYLNSNGTVATSNTINSTNFVYVEEGQSYAFSYEYDNISEIDNNIVFYTENELGQKIFSQNISYNSKNKVTIFTSPITGYVRLSYNNNVYNIQLEKNNINTRYEHYVKPITNIFINEPLRKVGEVADYLDFNESKVVRYIDADGIVLETPIEEEISIPNILTHRNMNEDDLIVNTEIQPSKIEVEFDN